MYPKITVYINNIRFIYDSDDSDDLRKLEILMLCRSVVWRFSEILISYKYVLARLLQLFSGDGVVTPNFRLTSKVSRPSGPTVQVNIPAARTIKIWYT